MTAAPDLSAWSQVDAGDRTGARSAGRTAGARQRADGGARSARTCRLSIRPGELRRGDGAVGFR